MQAVICLLRKRLAKIRFILFCARNKINARVQLIKNGHDFPFFHLLLEIIVEIYNNVLN